MAMLCKCCMRMIPIRWQDKEWPNISMGYQEKCRCISHVVDLYMPSLQKHTGANSRTSTKITRQATFVDGVARYLF